jgi:hypothetical protein
MRLEDIVVSLDLAKELRDSEYPQETLFFWYEGLERDGSVYDYVECSGQEAIKNVGTYAAPAASEIGEQLKIFPMIDYAYHAGVWISQIPRDESRTPTWTPAFTGESEADSRAKMWLYLKQNNLLLPSSQENK